MSSRVHLINPSNRLVRRGRDHAAVALRSGGGDRHEVGRSPPRRRNARADRHRRRSPRATSSASASIPAMPCAATKSAGSARERGAWVVYGGIHATLFPDEAHEHGARACRRQGRRRPRLAEGGRGLLRRHAAARLRRRARSTGSSSCRRAGTCCRRSATCGRRCRRCAAARSTARSARSGAPTARSRGSARSIRVVREIVELRRLGFRFIALADDNFYPVTFEDLAAARRRADHDAAARARGAAARAVRS